MPDTGSILIAVEILGPSGSSPAVDVVATVIPAPEATHPVAAEGDAMTVTSPEPDPETSSSERVFVIG